MCITNSYWKTIEIEVFILIKTITLYQFLLSNDNRNSILKLRIKLL